MSEQEIRANESQTENETEEGAGEGSAAVAEAAAVDESSEAEELLTGELIGRLEAELAEAKAEASSHLDQLQRLAAEFQNSRKRQEKQLSDAIERAGGYVIGALVPLLDDFELAFRSLPESLTAEEEAWVEGFRQIGRKLQTTLEEAGLIRMETTGAFDPHRHEAISSEPSEEVESGHIIATLRAGYEYKGRVLRPALVRIAM